MTGLNFRVAIIGIVGLMLVIHVRSDDYEYTGHSNNRKRDVPTIEFFISSQGANWADSMDWCKSNGYRLASLFSEDEKEALLEALKYNDFSGDTKFWVYSCTNRSSRQHCQGYCTELKYVLDKSFTTSVFNGAECNTKHKYICERSNN